MDCETCFIQASSTRARELNGKLKELREKALKEGVKIGMVKHIALSPTKELMKEILTDYDKYLKFRREFVEINRLRYEKYKRKKRKN